MNYKLEANVIFSADVSGYKQIISTILHLVNKRLDEWVGEDRMELSKLEPPKKEVKTPQKDGKMLNGSRPNSPERELLVGIGNGSLSS